MDKKLIAIIIILAILLISIVYVKTNKSQGSFCTPESRKAEFCTENYNPVCGWNDPEKIQCIRYPCAQTYSNNCNACKNENVAYWTTGVCPSGNS